MIATVNIPIGASACKTVEVTRKMTVAHFHSHMPEAYGTPTLVYLMEEAASAAVQDYLPEGWVSVGAMINVRHLAPTPVGLKVTATAKVVAVKDNLITFSVEAHDGIEKIGEGTHARATIETGHFASRMKLKARQAKS